MRQHDKAGTLSSVWFFLFFLGGWGGVEGDGTRGHYLVVVVFFTENILSA